MEIKRQFYVPENPMALHVNILVLLVVLLFPSGVHAAGCEMGKESPVGGSQGERGVPDLTLEGSPNDRNHDTTKVSQIGNGLGWNDHWTLRQDSLRLKPIGTPSVRNDLSSLKFGGGFTRNLLGYFITTPTHPILNAGVKSVIYFSQFRDQRISSIRFVRLHPFGTSLDDTTQVPEKWMDKAANRLHMNTSVRKLQMQLLFKAGDLLDPMLLAENEKLMRDLDYLEDVLFKIEPVPGHPGEVNVLIISKDRFEYAVSMSVSESSSDLEFVNENMFGFGHRLSVGFAQRNRYLPEMGIYGSYHVNNILGQFINSTLSISDTYLRKDWSLELSKEFVSSKVLNAGGLSFDHVSRYNYIADDHPTKLDTTVAYLSGDLWLMHAIPSATNPSKRTLLSVRYDYQDFKLRPDSTLGQSQFLRNHNFLTGRISFTQRNLYKSSLIYGYGITEDIPYGYNYELTAGVDRSQFGAWPYFNLSLSKAVVDPSGRYYSGHLGVDGFIRDGAILQGTYVASFNYFSDLFFMLNNPCRQFLRFEWLGGINRFQEEYLTIDGRFGLRDFYTEYLRGKNRLKINLETVRYLKKNFYGFRFTNYLFADFAFLSDNIHRMFTTNFYAGLGTGLRIYNASLVFKIVDIRLTWFPHLPPEGIQPFGFNAQGLTKSRFEDFLGNKPGLIRYE